MKNMNNGAIEIEASKSVQVIRLVFYFFIFLMSLTSSTDLFESRMDTFKLLFCKVFAVIMAITCIVEVVKLVKFNKLKLVINNEFLTWGTSNNSYHVEWNAIKSLIIVNDSQYEFTMRTSRIGVLPPVLKAEDYDLDEDEMSIFLKKKSDKHGFSTELL